MELLAVICAARFRDGEMHSVMSVFWSQLARVPGELLGVGLPAPAQVLREHRFAPDAPGRWCPGCGSLRCKVAGCATNGPAQTLAIVRLAAHDGALRDWVIAIKHNQWEAMGDALGRLLGQQVGRCHAGLNRKNTVVVPVPMPWIRRVDRGIDHSETIAKAVAATLRVRCVQPIRQRAGGTQVDSTLRESRLQRVERFRARPKWRAWRAQRAITGRTVVLVDDVRTTGATLALATTQLVLLGAVAVIPAVLSVTEKRPPRGSASATPQSAPIITRARH